MHLQLSKGKYRLRYLPVSESSFFTHEEFWRWVLEYFLKKGFSLLEAEEASLSPMDKPWGSKQLQIIKKAQISGGEKGGHGEKGKNLFRFFVPFSLLTFPWQSALLEDADSLLAYLFIYFPSPQICSISLAAWGIQFRLPYLAPRRNRKYNCRSN